MDTDLMVGTAKKYINALCEHDISVIEAIFDTNAEASDPADSDPKAGHPAIRESYLYLFSINIEAELTGNVCCAGNVAAFPLQVIVDRGDSRMKIEAIDLFEFSENGKVKSLKAYWGPINCFPL